MRLRARRTAQWWITLLAVAGVAAQTGPGAQQAERGAVGEPQTSTMDFTVVTRDGTPVLDLKADEVTLRIDGKVRPIRSLQLVRFAGDTGGANRPEPAFATNAATAAARAIVIIVDDESMPIGQERKLREALDAFLREVPAEDRLALVTVPHGGIKVDLTTDRERLRRAIAEISPISPIEPPSCRARTTLLTLRSTFELLARATDQPVTVAFLSADMVGSSDMEQAQRVDVASGRGGLSTAAGACFLQSEDFKRVGTAAAEARVQLFVIHPDFRPSPVQAGIENLRGVTGAPLFHLSSTGPEAGLTRMSRETSAYYLVTFDSEQGERLGVAHQANLRVNRRDVEVRSRPEVIVGRTRPAAAAAVEPAPTYSSAYELVRSGRAFREVSLRATSSSTKGRDDMVNVVSLFESADPSVKIASAAAGLFDQSGRAVAYWTGDAANLTTSPVAIGMNAPPGRYWLRIGVIDGTGRYGVVDDIVTAELRPAGPLQLSGLSLGVSRSGGFQPRLQFSKEASALAYVEFYGGAAGMPVGAVFEVAETTDGPALFRVPGSISATSDEGRFTVIGAITVGMLPPGDYVIRAVVGLEGQPAGRVIRTLHKVG